jgi:hypothetical protein
MDDLDLQVRLAAFRFLEDQMAAIGPEGTLRRPVLAQGFQFNGERVPIIGPQGIFKPRVLRAHKIHPPRARRTHLAHRLPQHAAGRSASTWSGARTTARTSSSVKWRLFMAVSAWSVNRTGRRLFLSRASCQRRAV